MKKRIWLLSLGIMLVTALSGCGKKENTNMTGTSPKDYVYKMEEVSFQDENINLNGVKRISGNILALGNHYNESDNTTSQYAYLLNDDGTIKQKAEFIQKENISYNQITIDREGNLYAIKNEYIPGETLDSDKYPDGDIMPLARDLKLDAAAETDEAAADTTAETDKDADDTAEKSNEAVDEESNQTVPSEPQDLYYLVQLSWDGKEVNSVQLNDIKELKSINEEDVFYVGDIVFDVNDMLYVKVVGKYCQFDKQGNFKKVINEQGTENMLEGSYLICLDNGKMIGSGYDSTGKFKIFEVDLNTGTIGNTYELNSSNGFSYYPGIGYDLYLTDNYGVYGWNLGSADKVQLMNFIDSDLGMYGMYGIAPINDKEFYGMYDDTETWNSQMAKFMKVDPKDVKDKTVLTLACTYSDWDTRNAVIKFNKSNENYRISIMDYGSLYNTDNDYTAGITKLNADIVSGRIPDIMMLNDNMPMDSYISKGILEDLKPYIEKDSELDINNYMPNVLEAFSVDGKLYRLFPSYNIVTLAGKTSDVGVERGWTVKEMLKLLDSKPEGTKLMPSMGRDNIIYNCMSVSMNQYIDWQSGKCSFDSEEFKDLLAFFKSFPETENEAEWREEQENYQSQWREGKILLQSMYVSNFRDYNYMEKGTFGEKITMKGYPSNNGDGSAISPMTQYAMSAKSSNKDGAWAFIRYFITDEYQETISYGLPLSIKRLDKMGEDAKQRPFYEDEDGNKTEYDDTYSIDGIDVVIPPMTDDEVKAFKELLYSFKGAYRYDQNLINIIKEEAAAYFKDQKNVDEVVDIIQNRIQIYVNENR